MLALILLALGPVWTPASQAADSKGPGKLPELEVRMKASLSALRDDAQRLEAMTDRYAAARSLRELDGMAAEREVAWRMAWERLKEAESVKEDYFSARNIHVLTTGMQRVAQFQRKEVRRPGTWLQGALMLAHLGEEHIEARARCRAAIQRDRIVWEAMREGLSRRERLLRGTGIALAIVMGLAVAVARRRGRVRVVPVPVAPLPQARLPEPPRVPAPPSERQRDMGDRIWPGAVLGGDYLIVRELGRGSIGPVYEAKEARTQRSVAVRTVRGEIQRSERDIDELLSKARRVAELRHPYLAELRSVFFENERLCLVAEFVTGKPLAELMEPDRSLPMGTVRNVMAQVAAALGFAHEQGLVHGDLKPSSVIVQSDGIAKLLDLGLAPIARKVRARQRWSGEEGASAYSAPEQELGELTAGCDLYAMGVLLYRMLTGKLPFEGPGALARKRTMDFLPASRTGAGAPADADRILHRALAAEPGLRFATAYELLEPVLRLPD